MNLHLKSLRRRRLFQPPYCRQSVLQQNLPLGFLLLVLMTLLRRRLNRQVRHYFARLRRRQP
jgi:hypothetical protein